jgi:hypothetical protein
MSFATMLISPPKQPGVPHTGSKTLFISTSLFLISSGNASSASVRDVCGQFCEIKEVKHNANEYGDTKIVLNNLRNDERLYGCSHGGVFLTIWKLEQ